MNSPWIARVSLGILLAAMVLGGTGSRGQAATEQMVELTLEGMRSIFPATDEELAACNKLTPSVADQRLRVDLPEGDVPLGRPLRIPIHFAPGRILALYVTQTVPNNNILQMSSLPVHVTLVGGMPTAIEIVPAQLGSVKLNIAAKYSDNAAVSQQRELKVVPSSSGLKTFSLMQGGHDLVVVLEDAEQDRQASLTPTVVYADLGQISLDDASQIKLSVMQDEDNPVMRVNRNGLIHALREGTAVITGNFAGAIDEQTVHVYSKDDAPCCFAKPKP